MNEYLMIATELVLKYNADFTGREAYKELDAFCKTLNAKEYAVWLRAFSQAIRDYYATRWYVGRTE